MFWLIAPTADVAPLATTYFYIVVWGAPAVLGLYGLSGWFIGMQNTRIPMFISIMQNVVNILVSVLLVYGAGMKIEGVALGTVIAQYVGFLAALALLVRYYGRLFGYFRRDRLLQRFRSFFNINRDIFLRTLCLVAVNLFFTSAGAKNGAIILSVNAVMMQLYLFYSYFMDGFAYAGEALGGRYYGAGNKDGFVQMLRHLFAWASGVTLLYTIVYVCFGHGIVALLTDEPQVLSVSHEYLWWIWLVPVASTLAFIWDGIFIGITATRGMLVSSFVSTIVFFAVYALSQNQLGNHGLWLAMIVYLLMRGVVQTIWLRSHINVKLL
jgi:MATE family multidrug resistance protein